MAEMLYNLCVPPKNPKNYKIHQKVYLKYYKQITVNYHKGVQVVRLLMILSSLHRPYWLSAVDCTTACVVSLRPVLFILLDKLGLKNFL